VSDRYEDVRRQLIQRGYLQGRIERFLLRDLVAAEGPRALARTSFKAALLGAPLLGALLAASTVAANKPLLSTRDALVLWLYFAILAGVALFVLDLIAAGLAAAWARRRGARASDSLRAGLVVAAPILVYLVVLWVRGRPDGGYAADLLFLAGATVTTALVAWLAGLVSLAGIVGRTGEVPDRNRRSALAVLAVLIPVAAAFFLVPEAISSAGSHAAAPSAFAPGPRAGRLLVVGVDGLDGALLESSADHGAADHLLALVARGALYPKHREPAEPPEVWTTIATGMSADAHGVRSAGATRLPGVLAPIAARSGPVAWDAALRFLLPARTVPASGAGRRVRALWEMAGLTRPASVVGWWASWPASGTEGDPPEGYVVSDRVLSKLLSQRAEDRDTAPQSLFPRLARDFPADRAAWRTSFDGRFADVAGEARALAWESFLIDTFAWRTTLRLLDDPAVATSLTYLPGLDILRTRLRGHREAVATVEIYLRWLDATIVAELADQPNAVIVLVADPGRSTEEDAEGFIAVVGGGAVPLCVGPTIGDVDVAPIALRLAGLPASREMRGHAPDRCFEGAAPALPPIATWGRRGRPVETQASDYDPEMVERLKSLGYLR
jgi:hypothetical protein